MITYNLCYKIRSIYDHLCFKVKVKLLKVSIINGIKPINVANISYICDKKGVTLSTATPFPKTNYYAVTNILKNVT